MKKHLQYLSYMVRHKFFVTQECFRRGLYWRGLVHDLSKFMPSEWFPYVNFFYGNKIESDTGYYHVPGANEDFDIAWLKHQHRNPHHWQYWILREDDGGTKVFEMPLQYREEMLCDWVGAGKAQGKPNTKLWYMENKDKMVLGDETRKWIEKELDKLYPLKIVTDVPLK